MTGIASAGLVYRCGVCGAEITILVSKHGEFVPRCCNTAMVAQPQTVSFYTCPVCGAEIGLIRSGQRGAETFTPRCCNTDMLTKAA